MEGSFFSYAVQLRLLFLPFLTQYGDGQCLYDFEGTQNGIAFSTNVHNVDTVFKFIIINQTGHIMTNKHAVMRTVDSYYFTVSDEYLKLKTCPYPGQNETLEFGIMDEPQCDTFITITVLAAISDIPIPGEVTVMVDSRTKEPEIVIYHLYLNATRECATYSCEISCQNDKQISYRIWTAGNEKAQKALFMISTYPRYIKYSSFTYELLLKCYDTNYYHDTLVTAKTNFTFIDTSATSSTEPSTIVASTIALSTSSTPYTSGTTLTTKKAMENLKTTKPVKLPSRGLFTIGPLSSNNMMTGNTGASSRFTFDPTIKQSIISPSSSPSTAESTTEVVLPLDLSKTSILTILQVEVESSFSGFMSSTSNFNQNSTLMHHLTTAAIDNYYSTAPKFYQNSTGSFFDKPANVIGVSAAAGAAAAGTIGAGTYLLANKKCDTKKERNDESAESGNTDLTNSGEIVLPGSSTEKEVVGNKLV